jgi:hypothetical protein
MVVGGRDVRSELEGNALKATPNNLLKFYQMYGHPIEITTANKMERNRPPSVTKAAFDELDQIRAHGIGVRLGRFKWFR